MKSLDLLILRELRDATEPTEAGTFEDNAASFVRALLDAEPVAYAFELANAVKDDEARTPTMWDVKPRLAECPPLAGKAQRNVRALYDLNFPGLLPVGPKTPAEPEPSPADDDREIVFGYRNHRGEKARRRVAGPLTVWHGSTKWHPLPQWFLSGHDMEKDAHRDFALADCRFAPETSLTHLRKSPSISPGIAIIVLSDGAVFYVGPLTQVPNENVIPHGSVVNLNTDDFARVQARMKELSPIATIEH